MAVVRPAIAADLPAASAAVNASMARLAAGANAYSDTARNEDHTLHILTTAFETGYVGVGEVDGVVVGACCLVTAGAPAFGLGPLAILPSKQGAGLGKLLMADARRRAEEVCVERGMRREDVVMVLTVDTYNSVGTALYAKLGYEVKEPLIAMSHDGDRVVPEGWVVSKLDAEHMEAAAGVLSNVLGRDAHALVEHARTQAGAAVASRDGVICGVTSGLRMDGFVAATCTEAAKALLTAAEGDECQPRRLMMPAQTHPDLFKWSLENGWRTVKQLLLMAEGAYVQPKRSDGFVYIPTYDG
mmetsp:Transcript_74074/g.197485  ORF Transcript_74074/g.197485 Transcript_74074/m.197485 type:complete len:300 (-) Transcript_74074:307-1206(-)